MNITFRQLNVFEAVVRHLSFTQAAQELHLTQPAVSMQIKQFEEAVGLPMFEQLGKKIFLTQAGKEMHHYCRNITNELRDAEEVLDQLKGGNRGHLDISVATTANYFATRLLAAFARSLPEITFSLDVTNRATLLQQLDQNEKDMVIMGRPPTNMSLETHAFMENPLVVIASPNHPLASKCQLELKDLANEMFVVRERGSGTRIAMQRFFADRGVEINTGMEMNSNEAIKQSAEAELGLGIVSVHTIALELETKRLVVLAVKQFPILRHWYLVYRQGKRLSPVAELFHQFVMENADNYIRSK